MQTEAGTPPDTNESDLVLRARTDRDALAELYDLYYPRILRYCLRRLFLRSLAEDVTSNVFLAVAGAMRSFAGTTHDDFVRWIYAIATNEMNAYLRQSRRHAQLLEEAVRRKVISVEAASERSSLDLLDWPSVYEALLALQPQEQSIISLRFFEDLPHEEIARILDMRAGAIRTALTRAIKKLRAALGVER